VGANRCACRRKLLGQTLVSKAGFGSRNWRPWSCLNLAHVPTFVRNSERMRFAEQVAKALNLGNVADFKKILAERGPELGRLFGGVYWVLCFAKTPSAS
jgi:hypothetical protein